MYRASLLTKWSTLMQENAQDLATIMTLESGKPLAESRGEVQYARSFLDYFAAEAVRATGAGGGFMVPTPFQQANGTTSPKGHIMAVQQAVGVSAMIAPWNFPLAMITRKVGPALAAGCTAVAKPSELTPLSAVTLKNLADRAGIPQGVFELITASRETTAAVGTEFCTNPLVKKISFTGSTRVGKLLMRQASDTVKRVSMELGGNAVFVVFEDADVDQAVDAAMASKFRNAGQTCVCADRFLVHNSVHDEFTAKLSAKVRMLRVGPGIQAETRMGPLISAGAKISVSEKVTAALDDGAILFEQMTLSDRLGPQFFPPTILTNVSPKSDIWKTETFGPVVAIRSFETEEEALEIANNCSVGLASYFCTNDLSRAFRFSHKLEAGMVGVNEGIMSTAVAPFGGLKDSGVGTEGSHLGIKEYLETKYIFMNA
ncbi:succinate semialdehyde dehydrogenase [Nitzschia inconspicua]|uniref:Succinate-semialdehyde dehydrogenase, mitochondrial n=1 Tax=Nitzschia inconspicua TaxID=303405 RepID=A0A9K3LUY1_9STRA|nr:succinate semialdehyde dehydrogenase [Nitzschia inconspicua]